MALAPASAGLFNLTVGELLHEKQQLIDISAFATVQDALRLLHRNGVLSVPVRDAPGSWIGSGGAELVVAGKQYIGIVSVLDLVTYVFREAGTAARLQTALAASVSQAIGSTNESLSLWVDSTDRPLRWAMEKLSKGVHRALVTPFAVTLAAGTVGVGGGVDGGVGGGGGGGCKILTQTDVVRHLARLVKWQAPAALSSLFSTPLSQLEVATPPQPLVRVEHTMSLAAALDAMLNASVSAAPVVDAASGGILSSLSTSDLRGVTAETAGALFSDASVVELLRRAHGGSLRPPVTCRLEEPLGEVVDTLLASRVHRAWFCDPQGRPVGVLTFTDVIRLALAADKLD